MVDPHEPRGSRRALLEGALALTLGAGLGAALRRALGEPAALARDDRRLVRGRRPDQLETPRHLLASYLTPTGAFFVRTHHPPPPEVNRGSYALRITGLVEREVSLSLEALERRPSLASTAVLQCAGNGRGQFTPRVPGAQWLRGAMGQARWEGPLLGALVREAGPREGARFVIARGLDRPMIETAPPYVRSLPLAWMDREGALLALRMNGAPLPHAHGGPARLCLPGILGNSWLKWVQELHVAAEPDPSFYSAEAYRMPRVPVAPGASVPKDGWAMVGESNLKAVIARPDEGDVLAAGANEVVGVALDGLAGVGGVEVSTDGGRSFAPAQLLGEGERPLREGEPRPPGSWVLFRHRFLARPGPLTVIARAWSRDGARQPEGATWNPAGYLWNACERVGVSVVA